MLASRAVPISPNRFLCRQWWGLLGWIVGIAFIAGSAPIVFATTIVPLSTEEHFATATAVFRGTIVEVRSFQDPDDGLIYTRTLVQVDEPLKGKLPSIVQVVHRGGEVNGRGERDGFNPQFTAGEQRLIFVSRRPNGTLFATQGFASALPINVDATTDSDGKSSRLTNDSQQQSLLTELRSLSAANTAPSEDVTDQAATPTTDATNGMITSLAPPPPISTVTNLLLATNFQGYAVSSRFVPPDRGEPIPYLVDASTLPSGISTNQALTAVSNALAAWTAVTSIKWRFEGFQTFTTNAASVTNDDGRLRLQLHDSFNYLTTPGVLGIGGRAYYSDLLTNTTWGSGGSVKSNEFHQTTRGYVVLKHTSHFFTNVTTMAEVLCHEIGHALSLAHTSEILGETNTVLAQSIMFFQAHADGRGAQLQPIDIQNIQQVHPTNNTPPFSYNRVMDLVTPQTAASTNQAGYNRIDLRGYDLQTTNLSVKLTNALQFDGTFQISNGYLLFNYDGLTCPFPCNLARLDPSTGQGWDQIYARFSDGTNASPFIVINVISLNSDSFPSGGDGLPDSWMINYFGNANPAIGTKHGPNDDADGDGLTNLQEFQLGTSPSNSSSSLKITSVTPTGFQFSCRPYDLYEVQSSSDLISWTRAINPILPTNSPVIVTGLPTTNAQRFYRVLRVP